MGLIKHLIVPFYVKFIVGHWFLVRVRFYVYKKGFKMINYVFIPLLILGSFVAYKRLTIKKKKFHAPPTNQLPS